MRSRALNAANDIFLSGTQTAVVDEGAQVVQAVRSRLLFYFGESKLDQEEGIPYFQQIFVKPANLPLAESLLKTEIIQTPGVAELIDFALQFDTNTRELTIQWEARTTFGVVVGATINEPVRIN